MGALLNAGGTLDSALSDSESEINYNLAAKNQNPQTDSRSSSSMGHSEDHLAQFLAEKPVETQVDGPSGLPGAVLPKADLTSQKLDDSDNAASVAHDSDGGGPDNEDMEDEGDF